MTAYKITSSTSVYTNDPAKAAFSTASAVADSLAVDVDAFLFSKQGNAVELDAMGAWAINLLGTVASPNKSGIVQATASTSAVAITIGVEGAILARDYGIDIFGASAITITNAGLINVDNTALRLHSAKNTVTNSGSILTKDTAIAVIGDSADVITNSGFIDGDIVLGNSTTKANDTLINIGKGVEEDYAHRIRGNISFGGGNDIVNNTGKVGSIDLGGGANKVMSSIEGFFDDITAGDGDDVIAGMISAGHVDLGNGNNTVTITKGVALTLTTGSGDDVITLTGFYLANPQNLNVGGGKNKISLNAGTELRSGVSSGDGGDSLSNAGKVLGEVQLGGGNNSISNVGVLSALTTLGGDDTLINSGAKATISGAVDLGEGKNIVMNSGTTGYIYLGNGNDTVTNSGHITLSGGAGDGYSIKFYDGVNKLTNSGTIDGGVTFDSGDDSVVNSGRVNGLNLGAGINSVVNSGSVGDLIQSGDQADTVTNTATGMTAGIVLGGGMNKIVNAGTVTGDIGTGDGNDTIVNAKLIDGDISAGGGTNVITNSGLVGLITFGDGDDTLTNSGTIDTFKASIAIEFGAGTNHFTNTGKVIGYANFGDGFDTIVNHGVMGSAYLEGGNNTVTNDGSMGAVQFASGQNIITNSGLIAYLQGGTAKDVVTNTGHIGDAVLQGGDDVYTGSASEDRVDGGTGADSIKLGGGNDTYFAIDSSSGHDVVDGGAGIDQYDAYGAMNSLYINLDTGTHYEPGFLPFFLPLAGSTAMGADVGLGNDADSITNFEDVDSGDGGDVIFGSAAANTIYGDGGSDTIFGYGGNDVLFGNAGSDTLVGGAGADRLTGGEAADTFAYVAVTDSGVTKLTRDVILDFQDGKDFLDFSRIDANAKTAADDAFVYVNGNSGTTPAAVFAPGQPGQLRSYWIGTGQIIEGDVDGDGKADFSIEIADPTHAIVFTSADFVL